MLFVCCFDNDFLKIVHIKSTSPPVNPHKRVLIAFLQFLLLKISKCILVSAFIVMLFI